MRVIKDYLLDKTSATQQRIYLPKNAKVVDICNTDSGLKLIVITDPTEVISELRTFEICAIAETVYADNIRYIGSFKNTIGDLYVVEVL